MKIFKKKDINSINGITLIALVITIIVLLILAGISISMLSGDNGILQRATDAKIKTERQSVVEQARTDILGYQAENKGGDLEKSQLKTVLEAYFEDVPDLTDMEKAEILNTELETLSKYGTHTIKVYEIYNGSFKQINTTSGKTVAELYDGKNNQNEQNYNENAMHIGDWIEYDAGNWTESKAVPDWKNNPLSFGGYTLGQSRNTNASGILEAEDEKYEGWRIFDISENNIILISAGCPEGYYDVAGNGYNTEMIFTGTTTGTINTHYPSTPRDWSIYENTYAKGNSARTLRKNDLDTWYNRYIDSMITDLSDYEKIENGYWDDEIQDYIEPRGIPNSIENKMISIMSNGYNYSLTDVGDNDRALTWSTAGRVARLNDGEDDGVYGIRILVALKNDIKFNETPTKLQKDGYSYNKWIISDN